MSPREVKTDGTGSSPGVFATTRWSVILAAGHAGGGVGRAALEELCATYRAPILAYARALGWSPEDAEDLTQGFFAHFIGHDVATRIERREGVRFRSFLLRCFKNYVADEYARRQARKRGGGCVLGPLEAMTVEDGAHGILPADDQDAERLFERAWASALLDAVLTRLELHYREHGKSDLFEQLHPFLLDRRTDVPVSGVAGRLGLSDGAVRQDICRMRRRYREIFRAELSRIVANPAEIDEEMRHLFAVICR